jgi:GT2 family glycosyltransferase
VPQSHPPAPTLAILICTVNRPEVLRRGLRAIAAGTAQPDAVLVSDDSADGAATAAVCAEFPAVRYLPGPRRGLCANRNAVIRAADTDFVSLLDDDAVVSADFVARARAALPTLPAKTLLTGTVIETDHPVVAGNATFLGFFGKPPRGRYENINLNCNVFPRAALAEAPFDETIFYGYEDMDVCARLLARGYSIRLDAALVNTHLPPRRTAGVDKQRFIMGERARFYTSVKRYLLWERKPAKLLAYLLLAPLHRLLHALKTGKWYDLTHAVTDMGFALRATFRERARLAREDSATG